MADEARIQDCNRRIAEGWNSVLPAGDWTASYLFWGPGGVATYAEATGIDREGRRHSISLPPDVHEALRELRNEMSDPQRGAWISADLKFTDDGVLESSFNWDRRFYWGTQPGFPWAPNPDPAVAPVPSDDDFVLELERYPRELMFLPAWYPRHRSDDGPARGGAVFGAREAATDARDPFEAARFAAVSLPDEMKPLQDAWGWPGVFTSVNDAVLGNLDRRAEPQTEALLGAMGEHARDLALDELVDDTVASAMLVLDRSPALAAVRLVREWFAIRDEAPPAGLESANRGEPLAELAARDGDAGDAARAARARLESLVRFVAEENVEQRFDA